MSPCLSLVYLRAPGGGWKDPRKNLTHVLQLPLQLECSLHLFARVGTCDATNSFKAYSTDFVRDVGIDSDTGFEIGIELVAKARRLRLRTAEIPTIWLERAQGTSSFKVVSWLPRYFQWYRFAFGPELSLDAVRAAGKEL